MDIKVGDLINIRHYSGVNPFKGKIRDEEKGILHVQLTREMAVLNFTVGDPVVFACQGVEGLDVYSANVINVNSCEGIIVLKVDETSDCRNYQEKRTYERFPVSMYADIRLKGSKNKYFATIKDISYYGMLIYSKDEFYINDDIEIDIYLNKSMLFLKASVIRKVNKGTYFEYGLRIIYTDRNSQYFMQQYIERLKGEQEEMFRDIRLFIGR